MVSFCVWTLRERLERNAADGVVQGVQAAQELHFCTLWAADNLHQFMGDFFVHCLQPFQVILKVVSSVCH